MPLVSTKSKSLRERREVAGSLEKRKSGEYILSLSAIALNFHQYVAILNLDRIHSDLCVRIVRGLARLRIVLPSVPRTYDFAVLDRSLAQRAALMQADVVDRGVSAVHIGDADFFVAASEFLGFVDGRKFGLSGEFDEFWHSGQALAFSPLNPMSPSHCPWQGINQRVERRPLTTDCYFGCSVCAIITCRLKFSTIFGSSRTSVGFFARVMVSILSCSFSSA